MTILKLIFGAIALVTTVAGLVTYIGSKKGTPRRRRADLFGLIWVGNAAICLLVLRNWAIGALALLAFLGNVVWFRKQSYDDV